jgi:acyl-CoA hydrolase
LLKTVLPACWNGTFFGGDALRLRHARRPVVTASSERIDFHIPVRQGQLAEAVGRATGTGRTSLTVEVLLWAEDLLTGERELCTKGSFVLFAVDERGRPAPLPSGASA